MSNEEQQILQRIGLLKEELLELKHQLLANHAKQKQFDFPLEVLVFQRCGHPFALLVEHVVEVLPMIWVAPLPRAPKVVRGVVDYNDSLVPVLDLKYHLVGAEGLLTPNLYLIFVSVKNSTLALVVDCIEELRSFDKDQFETDNLESSQAGFLHDTLRDQGRSVSLLYPMGMLTAAETDTVGSLLSELTKEPRQMHE
jgi:chemotaxis signal transduction protein